MKLAITGGTGFIGSHLARALVNRGIPVVLTARGVDNRDLAVRNLPNSTFVATGLDSVDELTTAFAACDAVIHCAGINRERGDQSYQRVHVEGTRNVVDAARRAGVKKVILIGFLRARPNCGSGYHESKYSAEQIVRSSGLDYSIIKEGITYGRGDHMISHLSWAMRHMPVFAYVGLKEKLIRPVFVDDLVRILIAAAVDGRLSRETFAVMGPEAMPLSETVNRVSRAIGKRPLIITRLPVWIHKALALVWETTMKIPLASRAQVRMLAEGLSEPLPATPEVPQDLAPRTTLGKEQILASLP